MKKVSVLFGLVGFVMAVGASFAFRPDPSIQGYEFVPGVHAQCKAHTVDCGSGTNACTIVGVSTTLRDTNDPSISCGVELKMP
jgi:hypothetical protein